MRIAPAFARVLRAAAAATVLIVGLVWLIAWRSPPFYSAPLPILPVPILTMAQYDSLAEKHPRPYVVHAEQASGAGAVLLFGAEHTRNPADPELVRLRREWKAFRPTAALVEGRLGFLFPYLMDPVEQYGEMGAAAALARADGVRLYSWEPEREWEIARMLDSFPAERVALFYVLRPYFSNLRFGRPPDPEKFVEEFRSKRTRYPGLEGTLPSVAAIDSLWARDFAGQPDWRETSDEYGLPGYLRQLSDRSNALRDEHLAAVLLDLVGRGERVFAVSGSSHAVKLDRALRAALGDDARDTARSEAPAADHHQHLFSPAVQSMLKASGGDVLPLITARDLVPLLDSAGIRRAVLLSVAYMFGSPSRTVEDEYAKVRAENDWTAAQAEEYPERLIAFCGFNPLKDYALDELDRCAKDPRLAHGIKLHLGNSDVQLDNPEHVERLRRVFRAANRHRMAIAVHMRASISRRRPYGAAQARVFLERVLAEAPDVPVQVAHLAGTGPGYDDPPGDSAMAFLADAVQRKDPRTRRLWFDLSGIMDSSVTDAQAALMARRIRQVGAGRILYGSDAAVSEERRPRAGWAALRRLPLTPAEFDQIARNVAPYFR